MKYVLLSQMPSNRHQNLEDIPLKKREKLDAEITLVAAKPATVTTIQKQVAAVP